MNFKIYIQLFNILSTFCFKQPIPFADSSLSKRKIHKVPVPGNEDVAVWWNKKSKEWNAVHDVCPHRQAELSLGVVNPFTNNIKCRYHGIEFNGCGECTMIPSIAFKPNMFSVKNYFVKEKYDLLWIDDKKNTDIIIDILDNKISKTEWLIEDTNISKELILENTIDSLHVNHVHHGVLPFLNRYKPFGFFDSSKTNWFNETGFSCSVNNNQVKWKSELIFKRPYYTYVVTPSFTIFTMAIEINNITRFVSNIIFPSKTFISKKVLDIIIKFMQIFSLDKYKIWKQDKALLNSQTKIINKYGKNYKSSGVADTPIILYNKWWDKYGNETI
tara:strand:+ start:472 stop:1461 length:990 start_codon:yes stop_codon:yes gene_type:complete